MKIVSYNPKDVTDVPAFMNKYLEEFKDDKYVMFIFDEIISKVKDKEELVHRYEELMSRLDLPYAFFPYYAHFNKILPNLVGKPSPRITAKMKDGFSFDVVQEPAFGMMILDIQKLNEINFKFNDEYKISFYIQDLIGKCFTNKLYFSKTYFIDVNRSYELFNDSFKQGFTFDAKTFLEEKKKYFEANKDDNIEQINDYVKNLKERYTVIEPEVVEKEEDKQ